MLSYSVYAGAARFNATDSRTRTKKSDNEHVMLVSLIIIDLPIFEKVQSLLKARNPRVSPPRVVSGPVLLTGLAYCASCSGAMTLRTGTSKTGKVHKYYACSTCARHGKTVCKGRSIPMHTLDDLVTSHLIDRLLAPDRLEALLASVAARRAERSAAVDERLAALQARADEGDDRLRRLYRMVEDGLAEMDDLLKERIAALKADRETAHAALARARGANRAPTVIPAEKVAAFGKLMRERLTAGAVSFRTAYLGSIIDRVEVDDSQIRICGRKEVLDQAVVASGAPVPGVRSVVRRWRRSQSGANESQEQGIFGVSRPGNAKSSPFFRANLRMSVKIADKRIREFCGRNRVSRNHIRLSKVNNRERSRQIYQVH